MEAPVPSGAEVHTRRRLLLFMSVDIAGSTAYKNTRLLEQVQPWLRVFYEFYRELPTQLRKRYVDKSSNGELFAAPSLWKAIGDELVFVSPVNDHRSVPLHLSNFRETVRAYRRIVQEAEPKLDLKASAWLAGFPVYNSVILLPRHDGDGPSEEDYIGPSIDTGFRLGKLAGPSRFMLSVELAYLLSRMPADEVGDLAFYYDNGVELKGVLGGRPYPQIWTQLHLESSLEKAEQVLKPLAKPVPRDALHTFTKHFIESLGPPLFFPFIEGDSLFNVTSPGYEMDYKRINEMWLKLYEDQLGQTKPSSVTPLQPYPEFVNALHTAIQQLTQRPPS